MVFAENQDISSEKLHLNRNDLAIFSTPTTISCPPKRFYDSWLIKRSNFAKFIWKNKPTEVPSGKLT